jgi:cytochrome c peroxidase
MQGARPDRQRGAAAGVSGTAVLALVTLGRLLFYDPRLSGNGTQSCASCHRQELAFTDGRARAVGSTGQEHERSAMSLVNVAAAKVLTWANPSMTSLEKQALVPMFGDHPVELGARRDEVARLLRTEPRYRDLFPKGFPGIANPYTIANAAAAIAAFERTIVSTRSAYDRYYYGGDPGAVSEAVKRGEVVFFTEGLGGCFRCHAGKHFSDGQFHNTAIIRGQRERFRTPTLRNVELTAPYMHDGSIGTLEEVVEHYAKGGNESAELKKLPLTRQNKADLVVFLKSLTDRELLTDERFSNPWPPINANERR